MSKDRFCYWLAGWADRPLLVDGEPIVRLIALTGTANPFQQLVCLTVSGRVLLRSADGRSSGRRAPDIEFGATGAPAAVLVA